MVYVYADSKCASSLAWCDLHNSVSDISCLARWRDMYYAIHHWFNMAVIDGSPAPEHNNAALSPAPTAPSNTSYIIHPLIMPYKYYTAYIHYWFDTEAMRVSIGTILGHHWMRLGWCKSHGNRLGSGIRAWSALIIRCRTNIDFSS